MNCFEKYLPLISASIDGEISISDKIILDKHLSECSECRTLCESMSEVSDVMGGMASEVPDRLKDSVMEKIKEEDILPVPVKKKTGMYKYSIGLAAACALLIFAATRFGGLKDAGYRLSFSKSSAPKEYMSEGFGALTSSPAAAHDSGDKSGSPAPAPTITPHGETEIFTTASGADDLNGETGDTAGEPAASDDYYAIVYIKSLPGTKPDNIERYFLFSKDGLDHYAVPKDVFDTFGLGIDYDVVNEDMADVLMIVG